MISDSGMFAKVGLIATFIGAALVFAFVSDLGDREPTVPGTVVANIEPVGEIKVPENQVQVMLTNGSVVNAWVPANSGFPFRKGTILQVTPYRSRFFGKRTYWADARRAKP